MSDQDARLPGGARPHAPRPLQRGQEGVFEEGIVVVDQRVPCLGLRVNDARQHGERDLRGYVGRRHGCRQSLAPGLLRALCFLPSLPLDRVSAGQRATGLPFLADSRKVEHPKRGGLGDGRSPATLKR
jgi:hypothetical protein